MVAPDTVVEEEEDTDGLSLRMASKLVAAPCLSILIKMSRAEEHMLVKDLIYLKKV